MLRAKYGLTHDDFDAMLEAQGGACAICGSIPEEGTHLAIDHCHESGRVRALLCNPCNTTVGMVERRPGYVALAFEYVQRFQRYRPPNISSINARMTNYLFGIRAKRVKQGE